MALAARAGYRFAVFPLALAVCITPSSGQDDARDKLPLYRSPEPVVLSPDAQMFYVGDVTAKSVVILDMKSCVKRGEISLHGAARGLALSSDGNRLFVGRTRGPAPSQSSIRLTASCRHAFQRGAGLWPWR